MEGPDREFRERIANRIDGLEAADDPEDELDNILAQIQELAALDRPGELAPGDEGLRIRSSRLSKRGLHLPRTRFRRSTRHAARAC